MFWINHPKADFTKNIQFSSIREFAMSLQNLNLFHLILYTAGFTPICCSYFSIAL